LTNDKNNDVVIKTTHNSDNVKPCCYSRTHLFLVKEEAGQEDRKGPTDPKGGQVAGCL
jgi:hypothetical protein